MQLESCMLVFEWALSLVLLSILLPLIVSSQFYCCFQRGLKMSPRDTVNSNETALNEILSFDSTIILVTATVDSVFFVLL